MILKYLAYEPKIDESCYVSETAQIIGRVTLKENANVWFGSVLRGDVNYIEVGVNTNIQDNCVIHINEDEPTVIGDNCTIGHGVIIHACTVGNNVLVGMGAIILDKAIIEDDVIIGAGALVPPGKRIPKGSLVIGSPCKIVRELTEEEIRSIKESAVHYVERSKDYKGK
ncbi:gamma carbonic anhydrase family protein [Paramaledivibacter caminithermalis]|jgi:carbonic anhydrase/acetyltransferase-like protein (isoleucine patch superfamily)|uniref:Carbonic anhydrase or acetyltransferase, isoleucine patch superfamily n=1 Tax=Paramaledivibacter caminithermalis (strain DSM 15212 / CIP 107654 / DViRD3) TaxID=1121301 RepID=A0A1M6JX44_PARC5|nr:gamma carbonic anhydrase family protein [Paramaledivibacter caminithermalis]SHJ51223.1 Carbonic anhydrase or acetyltransferase, isoleucine patch superfamily [Paramaledivibacter caminithermalis DSM 15212]